MAWGRKAVGADRSQSAMRYNLLKGLRWFLIRSRMEKGLTRHGGLISSWIIYIAGAYFVRNKNVTSSYPWVAGLWVNFASFILLIYEFLL